MKVKKRDTNMDKVEYRELIRSIRYKYQQKDYQGVVELSEQLETEKIRENSVLEMLADSYDNLGRYDIARDILLTAYKRTPTGKRIAYNLAMLSIKLDDLDGAVMFYNDYCKMAPRGDNKAVLLKYEIGKAGGVPVQKLARVLEQYTSREMDEKWLYELARLYHEMGNDAKCADTCDKIILWYANGDYEKKALELKNMHKSLTPSQQARYEEIMNSILPAAYTGSRSSKAEETQAAFEQESEQEAGSVQSSERVEEAAEITAQEAAAAEPDTEKTETEAYLEQMIQPQPDALKEQEPVEEEITAGEEVPAQESPAKETVPEGTPDIPAVFRKHRPAAQSAAAAEEDRKTAKDSQEIEGQMSLQSMFDAFRNQSDQDREQMNRLGEDRAAQILAAVNSEHDSSDLEQFEEEEDTGSVEEVIEPEVPLLNREDVIEPVDDGGEDLCERAPEFAFEKEPEPEEEIEESHTREQSVDATQYIPVDQIRARLAGESFEDDRDEEDASIVNETSVYSEIDPGRGKGRTAGSRAAESGNEKSVEDIEPGRQITQAERAIIAYETSKRFQSEEDGAGSEFNINELINDIGADEEPEALQTEETQAEETAAEAELTEASGETADVTPAAQAPEAQAQEAAQDTEEEAASQAAAPAAEEAEADTVRAAEEEEAVQAEPVREEAGEAQQDAEESSEEAAAEPAQEETEQTVQEEITEPEKEPEPELDGIGVKQADARLAAFVEAALRMSAQGGNAGTIDAAEAEAEEERYEAQSSSGGEIVTEEFAEEAADEDYEAGDAYIENKDDAYAQEQADEDENSTDGVEIINGGEETLKLFEESGDEETPGEEDEEEWPEEDRYDDEETDRETEPEEDPQKAREDAVLNMGRGLRRPKSAASSGKDRSGKKTEKKAEKKEHRKSEKPEERKQAKRPVKVREPEPELYPESADVPETDNIPEAQEEQAVSAAPEKRTVQRGGFFGLFGKKKNAGKKKEKPVKDFDEDEFEEYDELEDDEWMPAEEVSAEEVIPDTKDEKAPQKALEDEISDAVSAPAPEESAETAAEEAEAKEAVETEEQPTEPEPAEEAAAAAVSAAKISDTAEEEKETAEAIPQAADEEQLEQLLEEDEILSDPERISRSAQEIAEPEKGKGLFAKAGKLFGRRSKGTKSEEKIREAEEEFEDEPEEEYVPQPEEAPEEISEEVPEEVSVKAQKRKAKEEKESSAKQKEQKKAQKKEEKKEEKKEDRPESKPAPRGNMTPEQREARDEARRLKNEAKALAKQNKALAKAEKAKEKQQRLLEKQQRLQRELEAKAQGGSADESSAAAEEGSLNLDELLNESLKPESKAAAPEDKVNLDELLQSAIRPEPAKAVKTIRMPESVPAPVKEPAAAVKKPAAAPDESAVKAAVAALETSAVKTVAAAPEAPAVTRTVTAPEASAAKAAAPEPEISAAKAAAPEPEIPAAKAAVPEPEIPVVKAAVTEPEIPSVKAAVQAPETPVIKSSVPKFVEMPAMPAKEAKTSEPEFDLDSFLNMTVKTDGTGKDSKEKDARGKDGKGKERRGFGRKAAKKAAPEISAESLDDILNATIKTELSPAQKKPSDDLDDFLNSTINPNPGPSKKEEIMSGLDEIMGSINPEKKGRSGPVLETTKLDSILSTLKAGAKPLNPAQPQKPLSFDELIRGGQTGAAEGQKKADPLVNLSLDKKYRLSRQQRKDLAEFLMIEGMDEAICDTIEKLATRKKSGDETGGNLIVTGDAKTGKTFLAVEILKAVNEETGHGNPRVAKVQAQAINGRNVRNVLAKVADSDLIIENIGKLEDDTVRELISAMRESSAPTMVILEGNEMAAENIILKFPEIKDLFKTRINIGELTLTQWADAALFYAMGQGYSIEGLALLALHARIDEINTPDIRLGYAQVRKVVDDAIEKAEKRSAGKLFSAFSKKNDDTLIPLTEEDFM